MSRVSKIASLPRDLREQINRRLDDGEFGRDLLAWLNALPEVRAILKSHFDGGDISDQNLSEWRQGPFRQWLARQETLSGVADMASDAGELIAAAKGRISDHLATLLAARYASEFASWTGGDDEELRRKLRVLRELCRDLVELRRGDHELARLQIEQVRLDQEREKTEEEIFQYFRRWLHYTKVEETIAETPSDPEKRLSLLREAFGFPPPEKNENSLPDGTSTSPPAPS